VVAFRAFRPARVTAEAPVAEVADIPVLAAIAR